MGEVDGGWNEWARYVLAQIKEQSDEIRTMTKDLDDFKRTMTVEMALVKQRVAVISAICGFIPGFALALIQYLAKK